jgi:hypothetical protein
MARFLWVFLVVFAILSPCFAQDTAQYSPGAEVFSGRWIGAVCKPSDGGAYREAERPVFLQVTITPRKMAITAQDKESIREQKGLKDMTVLGHVTFTINIVFKDNKVFVVPQDENSVVATVFREKFSMDSADKGLVRTVAYPAASTFSRILLDPTLKAIETKLENKAKFSEADHQQWSEVNRNIFNLDELESLSPTRLEGGLVQLEGGLIIPMILHRQKGMTLRKFALENRDICKGQRFSTEGEGD